MRKLQSRVLYDLVAVQQNVDIDRARPVENRPNPPHLSFHTLRAFEESDGRKTRFKLRHLIEKPRLLSQTDRLSLANARHAAKLQFRAFQTGQSR